MPVVPREIPLDPMPGGFLDPDLGYAGGADAVCPMRVPASGAEVLVLREHRGVLLALSDRRFSIARVDRRYATTGSAFRSAEDLPRLDPPETTEIRRPLGVVFSEKAIAKHRTGLATIARDLARALPAPADLMRDYCDPFVAAASSSTMGLPLDDWPYLQGLAGKGLGPFEHASEAGERTAAWQELYAYSEKLVAEKRARPDGLMLSVIITVLDRAGLPPRTVLHTVATVVVGLATPTAVLAVIAFELLRRPGLLAACLADPARWARTINEFMRYRANFGLALPRIALEDVPVNDECVVRKGAVVVPSLLAAAHDPARTPHPDEFDVDQDAARNIVFGAGPHLCPGAALGRQWLEAGLHGLFSTRPDLRLVVRAEELHWQRGIMSVPEPLTVT
jgi:cytochrome P450